MEMEKKMKWSKSWFVWSFAVALSVACGSGGDDGGSNGDGDGDSADGDAGDGDGDAGDGDAGDGDTGDGDAGDGDAGGGDAGDGDAGDGDGDAGDGDVGDGDSSMGGMGGFGGADPDGSGGMNDMGSGGTAGTIEEQIEAVCGAVIDRYTEEGNSMCAGMLEGCVRVATMFSQGCEEEYVAWHTCLLESDTLGTPTCLRTEDCLEVEQAWRSCSGPGMVPQ